MLSVPLVNRHASWREEMLGVSSLTPAPPWLLSVMAAILMLLANTAVEAAGQSTQEGKCGAGGM